MTYLKDIFPYLETGPRVMLIDVDAAYVFKVIFLTCISQLAPIFNSIPSFHNRILLFYYFYLFIGPLPISSVHFLLHLLQYSIYSHLFLVAFPILRSTLKYFLRLMSFMFSTNFTPYPFILFLNISSLLISRIILFIIKHAHAIGLSYLHYIHNLQISRHNFVNIIMRFSAMKSPFPYSQS